MRVTPNITAPNASRSLADAGNRQQRALERASVGPRGTRASAEGAVVAQVDGLRAGVNGSLQAQRTAQEGISLIQTTDSALAEVHAVLARMREVVVRSDQADPIGRAGAQGEIAALQAELGRIGERTTFSGQPVFADFSGDDAHLVLHLGAHATDSLTALSQNLSLDPNAGGVLARAMQVDVIADGTRASIDVLDTAINDVAAVRTGIGEVKDRLEHAMTAPDGAAADVVGPLADTTATQVRSAPATAQAAQAQRAAAGLVRHLQT